MTMLTSLKALLFPAARTTAGGGAGAMPVEGATDFAQLLGTAMPAARAAQTFPGVSSPLTADAEGPAGAQSGLAVQDDPPEPDAGSALEQTRATAAPRPVPSTRQAPIAPAAAPLPMVHAPPPDMADAPHLPESGPAQPMPAADALPVEPGAPVVGQAGAAPQDIAAIAPEIDGPRQGGQIDAIVPSVPVPDNVAGAGAGAGAGVNANAIREAPPKVSGARQVHPVPSTASRGASVSDDPLPVATDADVAPASERETTDAQADIADDEAAIPVESMPMGAPPPVVPQRVSEGTARPAAVKAAAGSSAPAPIIATPADDARRPAQMSAPLRRHSTIASDSTTPRESPILAMGGDVTVSLGDRDASTGATADAPSASPPIGGVQDGSPSSSANAVADLPAMAADVGADAATVAPAQPAAAAPLPPVPQARAKQIGEMAASNIPSISMPLQVEPAIADAPLVPVMSILAPPQAEAPIALGAPAANPIATTADAPVAQASQPVARPARAEAVSLLQLVRDHMANRGPRRADIGASEATAPSTSDDATPVAMTTLTTGAGPTLLPTAGAPAATLQSFAPMAPIAASPTDLSVSLGAQVVDMGVSGQWIDALARDIAGLSANGAQGRFQINADQLGPIQVDIRQGADGAAVSLTVANEAAELALRQDSDRLKLDAGLSAVRISEVRVERAPHGAEQVRSDLNMNHNGSQSPAQGHSAAQGHGMGQSSGQSHMQGRGQGRENIPLGHKAGGDAVVLNHEEAGEGVRDTIGARYA